MLDQEPVVKIAFDVPQGSQAAPSNGAVRPPPSYFPCEMKPSFITGVDGAVVSNFLGRFFSLFDTQRPALQGAYHPSATFSFSANTGIPARARLQGFQHSKEMPNQPKLEWGRWIDGDHGGSRNLERIAGQTERAVATLHIGVEDTLRALAALPPTVHDVSGAPEKFCIDAWPAGSGANTTLFVNVHGQFTERKLFQSLWYRLLLTCSQSRQTACVRSTARLCSRPPPRGHRRKLLGGTWSFFPTSCASAASRATRLGRPVPCGCKPATPSLRRTSLLPSYVICC
jgi:hypothetical protein